jgi:membrane protein DedA with SNARE-associated domain
LVGHLLESIPPEAVYLIVGLMIMVESLGIPLPGEIALVTAAVLATQHKLAVVPGWIAVSASAGAIAGDSIGFYIGHRFGKPLFDWLGRKFPRHFGPSHVAVAERFFARYGAWAVFFGRFIALLRIFSGPLAGSLHMPYGRFLFANACGGIIWASGITYLIWFLGQAAEKWLSRASWIGLVVAVVVGLAVTLLIRRRTSKLVSRHEAESAAAGQAESAAAHEESEPTAPAETATAYEAEAPAKDEEAPSPARPQEAPSPARPQEAPSPARPQEAPSPARPQEAPSSVTDEEARRPAGNGKAGPLASQRTESDR